MNNQFTPLVCDDDVILFEKDTFKISRLKELLSTDMNNKVHQRIYNQQTQKADNLVINSFAKVSIGQERIELSEIQSHFIIENFLLGFLLVDVWYRNLLFLD